MVDKSLIPPEFREDVDCLSACFGGEDGGRVFILLCMFLRQCAGEGNDVPFLRQAARLLRTLDRLDRETRT